MNPKTAIALAAVAIALTGCGGGGGGGGSAPAASPGGSTDTAGGNVPAAAFQGTDAFVAYVAQLITGQGDTGEPLTLPDGAAPTSDTTEPSGA